MTTTELLALASLGADSRRTYRDNKSLPFLWDPLASVGWFMLSVVGSSLLLWAHQ